jgi:hypothetical protein
MRLRRSSWLELISYRDVLREDPDAQKISRVMMR